LAGAVQTERRKVFNIAGPSALTLREIAETSARAAGGAPVSFRAFPSDRKPIDIGSFQADLRRARQSLGWSPRIRFDEGIATTLTYYREHAAQYIAAGLPLPPAAAAGNPGEQRKACDAA
ncbi:MAG: NAD(P)-dependent oxidoreductase, partial [Bryobacterales bacterium]|nr:NAD(P)-dependent oxidoreductase [Bryobacterales bacterium]